MSFEHDDPTGSTSRTDRLARRRVLAATGCVASLGILAGCAFPGGEGEEGEDGGGEEGGDGGGEGGEGGEEDDVDGRGGEVEEENVGESGDGPGANTG